MYHENQFFYVCPIRRTVSVFLFKPPQDELFLVPSYLHGAFLVPFFLRPKFFLPQKVVTPYSNIFEAIFSHIIFLLLLRHILLLYFFSECMGKLLFFFPPFGGLFAKCQHARHGRAKMT